jgi:hypothetical protein
VPSGIAIIGTGNHPATLEQHYYDSRGVARIYQMMSLNGRAEGMPRGTPSALSPRTRRHSAHFGRRNQTREGTPWASSLGRHDRPLTREGDRDRPVLIGPPDLRADAVELGERIRVRMTVRIRLTESGVLPPFPETSGPFTMTSAGVSALL